MALLSSAPDSTLAGVAQDVKLLSVSRMQVTLVNVVIGCICATCSDRGRMLLTAAAAFL